MNAIEKSPCVRYKSCHGRTCFWYLSDNCVWKITSYFLLQNAFQELFESVLTFDIVFCNILTKRITQKNPPDFYLLNSHDKYSNGRRVPFVIHGYLTDASETSHPYSNANLFKYKKSKSSKQKGIDAIIAYNSYNTIFYSNHKVPWIICFIKIIWIYTPLRDHKFWSPMLWENVRTKFKP